MVVESHGLLETEGRKPYHHRLEDSYFTLPEPADLNTFTRDGHRFV